MHINKTVTSLLEQKIEEIEALQDEISVIIKNIKNTCCDKTLSQINVLELNGKNQELIEEINELIDFCFLIFWN